MSAHDSIRMPWTWVFRAVLLVSNLAVLAGMMWIRAEIQRELEGYVTKAEFAAYQDSHNRWGDEVIKRLQASVDELTRRADRIETKLDRLAEKRTASVPPDNKAAAIRN